tara:strand:+ start:2135 stop:2356 length:222 start_codon:yes stop_codon:yes gene_type:complete
MLNREQVTKLIHLFYNHVGINKDSGDYYLAEDGFHHFLVELLEPNSDNMTDQEYSDVLDSIENEFCPTPLKGD